MIIPDTNLLIYAYDETSPHHRAAKDWWEQALGGSEPIGIPWIVVLAFTRLMTHPHLCTNPLSVAEVAEIAATWMSSRCVRMIQVGENAPRRFFELLEEAGTGGNLSTDAFIALHAMEHSATLCSNDRDFDRFQGVKVLNPLSRPR